MKALELVVHPPLHPVEQEYIEDSRRRGMRPVFVDAAAIGMLHTKRLTDAELAAEYHSWDSMCRREQWIEAVREDYTDDERRGQYRLYERLNTLYRFATHPHYDEMTP